MPVDQPLPDLTITSPVGITLTPLGRGVEDHTAAYQVEQSQDAESGPVHIDAGTAGSASVALFVDDVPVFDPIRINAGGDAHTDVERKRLDR
ncbi:MAG: hypothetical protein U5K81_08075 [Trueperaceae bacterium]|nr:hypothetical protein [Trueperaceae bacterium]